MKPSAVHISDLHRESSLSGRGVQLGGREKQAFCLLDQRTFEFMWATIERIAQHKTAGNI